MRSVSSPQHDQASSWKNKSSMHDSYGGEIPLLQKGRQSQPHQQSWPCSVEILTGNEFLINSEESVDYQKDSIDRPSELPEE